MKELIFVLVTTSLVTLSIISIIKMKIQIRDLKEDILINEKILSKRIDDVKKDVDSRSRSLLEESKSHLDAALIAISKRIGKREKPTDEKK